LKQKLFSRPQTDIQLVFRLPRVALTEGEIVFELLGAEERKLFLVRALTEPHLFQTVYVSGGTIACQGRFKATPDTLVRMTVHRAGVRVHADRPLELATDVLDPRDVAAVLQSSRVALHCNGFDLGQAWRTFRRDSGWPTTNYEFRGRERRALTAGLSILVATKNHARTIGPCLEALAPLVDEIIVVDNDSQDDTVRLALAAQRHHFNIRVHRYPGALPAAGREHGLAVLRREFNTRAHFYNFGLSKVSRFNVLRWEPDWLALDGNFAEFVHLNMLRTRGDDFSLWFGGVEVFEVEMTHWLDRQSVVAGGWAFSKLHGQKWCDALCCEELEQSYLYASVKNAFSRPVFIKDSAVAPAASENGKQGLAFQSLERFVQLEKLNAGEIIGRLDPVTMANRAESELAHYAKVPKISLFGETIVERNTSDQIACVVLVFSCEKNRNRKQWMRRSWVADFRKRGIPVYFVYGRPGQPSMLIDDEIYLDVPDNYESFIIKVCEAFRFVRNLVAFSHIVKIDDDVCLNVAQFDLLPLRDVDYTGGRRSYAGVRLDWHVGKCENSQLDEIAIVPRKSEAWFDGGSTYCLSARAVDAVLARVPDIYSEMYEDVAIASAIAECSQLVAATLPGYRGYKSGEPALSGNVFYVGDIDSDSLMQQKYAELRARSVFDDGYEADANSADVEDMAAELGLSDALNESRRQGAPADLAGGLEHELQTATIVEASGNDNERWVILAIGARRLGRATCSDLKIIYDKSGGVELVFSLVGEEPLNIALAGTGGSRAEPGIPMLFRLYAMKDDLVGLAPELAEMVRTASVHISVVEDLDRAFWELTAETSSKRLQDYLSNLNFARLAATRSARVEAADLPGNTDMFFALEHSGPGQSYRWTGPNANFSVDVFVDRSASLKLSLVLVAILDRVRQTPIRLSVDGAMRELRLRDTKDGIVAEAVLPPRDHPGPTRLLFSVPAVLRPSAADVRLLGVAFRSVIIEPHVA